MIPHIATALLSVAACVLPQTGNAQAKRFDLITTQGLKAVNTVADAATFKGKRAVRVAIAPDIASRPDYRSGKFIPETLVRVDGVEFSSGVIEVELAGSPAAGSDGGARGFVGIAFRVQPNDDPMAPQTYDAFYLRPTNGRADDQERRNHAVQYISHPEFPWSRLRRETPSRYEAYADILPDTWTKIRIEVRGAKARLFVGDSPQPVLVVNDVKTGESAKGGVALWIDQSTIAHFRNLVVTPQ